MRYHNHLKTIFAPFLPFSSEKLHTYLGYDTPLFGSQFTQTVSDAQGEHSTLQYKPGQASGTWAPSNLEPGKAFLKPEPLYQKLDPSVAEEERQRLG